MRRLWIPLASLALLAACQPLIEKPREPELPFEPEIQPVGEQQAETVNEGEEEATQEQAPVGLTIVERLLPNGFLEIGNREAPVTLLVFTEHHCRYCKDFYHEHFLKLHKDFIEPGKLKLQIAILPVKKYLRTEQAAAGLLCAALQGKGIPMHELLLELGAADTKTLMSEATTLELDTKVFAACLEDPETAKLIELQASLARSLDVTLVPTFFLNGEKSVGLPYYPDFKGLIEAALSP